MRGQPKKPNVEIASTVLANHRRELFAQLLVQGETATDLSSVMQNVLVADI
jgi:hypothetical protein